MNGVPAPVGGLPAPWWLVPAGAAISFVSALCGIGGGLFVGPILTFALGYSMRAAAGTSVFHVLATGVASTAIEVARADSHVHWRLALVLAAMALLGTHVGYALSKTAGRRAIAGTFAVAALAAAARMLWVRSNGAALPERGVYTPVSWNGYAIAGLGGFAGGVLTPLLGVGGGLVFVPAMALGIPSLGFASARATSLAVILVAAARSCVFYWRDGLVAKPAAARLVLGASIGSVAGVLAVHAPPVVAWAKALLALVLVGVALRYGREALVRRERAPA
jgi:uncharacterized membrane protein YfcA